MATKPKKILVVEDDKFTQTVICELLKSAGYRVVAARDAATAFKLIHEEEPDLITLDVLLTGDSPSEAMNGFELATWLKRQNPERHIPIIVISGGDPQKVVQGASDVAAHYFLPKPIQRAKLLTAVTDVLKSVASEPPAAPS